MLPVYDFQNLIAKRGASFWEKETLYLHFTGFSEEESLQDSCETLDGYFEDMIRVLGWIKTLNFFQPLTLATV